MSRIYIPFSGVDASGLGYGRTRSCPTYGAGYAAYMFGSSLTDTPTKNLFTDIIDGRLVGAPDAIGLAGGPQSTSFAGTISGGNLLTVTGTVSGDPLAVGMTIELATAVGGTQGIIASLGTGTGGAGTYNLVPGATNGGGTMRAYTRFFETAGLARDIFNIGSAVTLISIFQAPVNQGLITDDITGGSMGMLVQGAGEIQTFGRDSAAVVVNVTTGAGFTNGATTWTMGVSQFSTTSAQGFIQRSGPARVASAAATTRTANPVGSTTKKLRTHYYNNATPLGRIALLAIYTKLLSSGEMDDFFSYARDLLNDAGQVL